MSNQDILLIVLSSYYISYKLIDLTLILNASMQIKNKISKLYDFSEAINPEDSQSITIIIPFNNESRRLFHSIYTVINQDYLNFSIILVDDGSTNEITKEVIKEFEFKKKYSTPNGEHIMKSTKFGKSLSLIVKAHSGKSDSLNVASFYAKDEYILFVDADTMLKNDALKRYSYYITTDTQQSQIYGSIMGVNNNKIYNRGESNHRKSSFKILTTLQELEYYSAISFQRIVFSKTKSNFIVSGANFLIKRSTFLDVGGYSKYSITEDMDLCMKVIKYSKQKFNRYPVTYIPEELSSTEVPFKVRHLISQRARWFQGLIQTLWKFKLDILKGKLGNNCMFNLIYYIIFIIPNAIVYLIIGVLILNQYSTETLVKILVITSLISTIQNLLSILIHETEKEFDSSLKILTQRIFGAFISTYTLVPIDRIGQFIGISKIITRSKDWGIKKRQS